MRHLVVILALVGTLGCSVNHHAVKSTDCAIEGPEQRVPPEVWQIHLGMSKAELSGLLGEEDYSPTDGQYYFSTGGECPLEGTDLMAPCGVVAEFRADKDGELQVTDALQSCWWGAIGE